MAQLLTVEGGIVEIEPRNGKFFTLDELQRHVDGPIEVIKIPGRENLMVVNEEGRVKGLEWNENASHRAAQMIVGDAVAIKKDQIR